MRLLLIMASYNPPSEDLPIFDNSVFVATNTTTLTRLEANKLYLRKTIEDTCTALETFSAGLAASFINVSGTITSATMLIYSVLICPTVIVDEILTNIPSNTCNVYNNQVSGILNIATNARTANLNIATGQINNQLSIGSNFNTQTNIYGGLIAMLNAVSITGTLDVTSTTTTPSIITNNITGATTTDPLYISNGVNQLGRIYIGGAKSASSGGVYIGGSNNPISVLGSSLFVNGLESQNNIALSNSAYIVPPITPPTLPINSLGYYYNYPILQTTTSTTGYKYNPATNTSGASNYFNAGIYVANINSIVRFGNSVTAGTYVYYIGIASGTTAGTVTTSTVTDITPVSGSMREAYFGNIINIDFSNSHTLCFTLAVDSYVNIFSNFTSMSVTGGTVSISLLGCVRRIA